MKTMRHLVAGFVLFAVLITLLLNVYTSLEDDYGITDNATLVINGSLDGSSGNIAEHFKGLDLIEGIALWQNGIQELNPGTGTQFDVLGGLVSVGVGALKVISGVVTIPFEVGIIIGEFYLDVPPIITGSLIMIVVVYVGFILLSAYLGKDV